MPLEERWNTHHSDLVEQTLFGVTLRLAQNPASHDLGTTVWDASIVLAKFLEKNMLKGDFSRARMINRHVLEMGSGMGLAGMAAALMGAHVTFSDLPSVLPLLERNVDMNVSPAAVKLASLQDLEVPVGTSEVVHLDWADQGTYANAKHAPYDFVLAADCVYNEQAVPPFLRALAAHSGRRTHIIIANEFRSQAVHDVFMSEGRKDFLLRRISPSKLHSDYEHPLIHLYHARLAR